MSIDGYSAALDVGAHLEKRINENHADHEQRITDLESQVRSLFQVTEKLETNMSRTADYLTQRIGAVEWVNDEDTQEVTLRIRVERGTR